MAEAEQQSGYSGVGHVTVTWQHETGTLNLSVSNLDAVHLLQIGQAVTRQAAEALVSYAGQLENDLRVLKALLADARQQGASIQT